MRIEIFTIFPEYFEGPLRASLLGRAQAEGLLDLRVHDPRAHTTDRHRSVDDAPYGGGAGMVMAPGPLFDAVEAVGPTRPLFLLSAGGRRFDQAMAKELAGTDGFSLLCGRYEGVDQRVAEHLCDDELSVGDYVLAGRRSRRARGDRRGRPAGARGDGKRSVRARTSRSGTACSSIRSTPARRSSGAGWSPKCFGAAITSASPDGVEPRRCIAPCGAGRTSANGRCRPTRRPSCASSPTRRPTASIAGP